MAMNPINGRGAHLSDVSWAFNRYDQNHDNRLSDQEIAKGSLELRDWSTRHRSSGNTAEANRSQTLSELLATFLVGGIDQQGLKPDRNGDGQISFDEVSELAQLDHNDGQLDFITSSDFKIGFPRYFQAGGNSVDFNRIATIAGNTGTQTSPPITPGTGSSSVQARIAQLKQLIQLILSVLQNLSGGSRLQQGF